VADLRHKPTIIIIDIIILITFVMLTLIHTNPEFFSGVPNS